MELINNITSPEKCIIVGIGRKNSDREIAKEHLDELELLAKTAGAEVLERIYQELEKPNPATAIGKGKVQEIKELIQEKYIQLVIFDDDLTPVQARNLEKEFNVKVMDRTGLILDIFAQHARTNEAKTQVELAQLEYLLPRLTRMWTHLSKQYGGIGTKGPGETQIESDRRLIRRRIQKLKAKLEEIDTQKEQQRKGRNTLPRFALIGYTNAGKSTLMNLLTNADVLVEDKLFATLDTTVRAFEFTDEFGKATKILISDTVGFIRKLPANLVASFRSTLAEAREADYLLHIIDSSEKNYIEHIKTVEETLKSLNIKDKPILKVFNKIDLIQDKHDLQQLIESNPDGIFISAQRGINIPKLLQEMQKLINNRIDVFKLEFNWNEMDKVSQIYSKWDVVKRFDEDNKISLIVKVPNEQKEKFINQYSRYIMDMLNDRPANEETNSDGLEANDKKSDDGYVKNIIRDTRRDIRYVVYSNHKLSRREMLDEVKKFNYNPLNIRQKPGTTIEIYAEGIK
ncbi:MAG: GTPase HflX [Candidatus Kapabacteria bacterium]|nr:GTPase HflX [Candidatus Kapabacteria bacterium]